jgi:hypothetical protein
VDINNRLRWDGSGIILGVSFSISQWKNSVSVYYVNADIKAKGEKGRKKERMKQTNIQKSNKDINKAMEEERTKKIKK